MLLPAEVLRDFALHPTAVVSTSMKAGIVVAASVNPAGAGNIFDVKWMAGA